MEFPVQHNGEAVGIVTVVEQPQSIQFEVTCALQTEQVMRCYGLRTPEPPLLIGVLEPLSGTLRLQRRLSRQSIGGTLPERYMLLEASQPPPVTDMSPAPLDITTGDPLLDTLVREQVLRVQRLAGYLRLSCPFDAQRAFPLAFAAVACTVEQRSGIWIACLDIPFSAQ